MMENRAQPEREHVQFEPYFEVLNQRWTHIPGFLSVPEADELFALGQRLPSEQVPGQYLRAHQHFERFGLRLDAVINPSQEWLATTGQKVENYIHNGRYVNPDFASFNAAEVAVQRYGKDGILTGHKDEAANRIAIGILSLGDDATLVILEEDRQTIINSLVLHHGDFVILAAHGLGNNKRPMHALWVPNEAADDYDRISITYRDSPRLPPSLGYRNGT